MIINPKITVLTTTNKESFLIPSKDYTGSKYGKWSMAIESLTIEGIAVSEVNSISDYTEKELETLRKVNSLITINAKPLIDFVSSYDNFYLAKPFVVNTYGQEAVFGIFSDYEGSVELDYSFYKEETLVDRGHVYNKVNYSAKEINYDKVGNPLENRKTSFAVLRTNPKFTGNIKLVVDSSMNMYLDTFKVSNKLTDVQYRHAKVSGESSLSNDIRNIFGSLPKGDLYKIPTDSLEAHKMFTEYERQYETTYNYGARTNDDYLYSENFKILAPLWINQVLPDFFAIFRIEDSYNLDSYEGKIDDNEKFNDFLKNGKLVKLFDMRRSSPLGVYLNNHYNEISQYPGSAYLQFVEQEQNDSINWQGKNSWIGISVDKGLIVKKTETSYFANKILNESEGVQEKFNSFLMDGFERNNLVSANLINLEFMFDDPEAESYKMHRYFGLYLKENDFLTYQFIDKRYDSSTQAEKIYKYSADNSIIDDSFLIGEEGILSQDKWSNRMFFALNPFNGIRVKTADDLNYFLKNSVANVPYKNIASFPVSKLQAKFNEFITINLKEALVPGEHLRILIPSYRDPQTEKINSLIFEIVLSDDHRLANTDGVFPYVVYNKSGILADNYAWYRDQIIRKYPDLSGINYYEGKRDQNIRDYPYVHNPWYEGKYEMSKVRLGANIIDYPNVYRLSVYTQDFNNPNKTASIAEQIRRIATAVDKFGIDFKIGSFNNDSLSIVSSYRDTTFQRITSNILNANVKEESIAKKIGYFGNSKLDFPTYRLNYDSMKYSSNDFIYAPLDFELLGDRESTIVKFVKNEHLYEVVVDDFSKVLPISLYKNTKGQFNSIGNFDIVTYKIDDSYQLEIVSKIANQAKVNLVQSPLNLNQYVISTSGQIWIEDYKVNLYSPCQCQVSLMGLLPVNDFDSYINYSTSQEVASNVKMAVKAGGIISIGSKDECFLERLKMYRLVSGKFKNYKITAGKSFIIIDDEIVYAASGSSIERESIESHIEAETDCEIISIDSGNDFYKFSVKNPILAEIFFYNEHNQKNNLISPLVIPTVSNWESVGTYFDGNSILDVKTVTEEYNKSMTKDKGFFTQAKSYVGQIYPNQYVKSGLDYYIKNQYGEYESFKEYLLDASSLGNTINTYLSDEVAPNYTIGYYNKYVNTLEFVLSGMKFSLSFNNANFNSHIRLSEYNNYGVFLVNDYNPGKKNEMIINTKERTILLINHQFNLNSSNVNPTNIKLENGDLVLNKSYNFISSPYLLNFDKSYGNNQTVNVPTLKTSNDKIDGSIFYQIEKFERPNSYLNGTDAAIYFSNDIVKSVSKNSVILENSNKAVVSNMNSERDMILSVVDPSTKNAEYMKKHAYLIDPSSRMIKDDSKSSYENLIDSYMKSFTSTMEVYIKNENDYIFINQTEEYNPLIIQVTRPKNIKFNYGYFVPKFNEMVSFHLNETGLIESCKMDFNSCNTSFKDIKSLKNFYCSKVFNDFSNLSLEKNYYILPEFSLLQSNWDKGFYRQYTSENSYVNVDGVAPGIEDTTFFGSSCIKVKDKKDIIITDFSYSNCLKVNDLKVGDYSTTKKETTYDDKEISINLTLALYNYFINNEVFLSNWKDFQYNDTYIKNYIKNGLQKYFKIDQKRNLILKEKTSTKEFEMNFKSPNDESSYTEVKNFKSVYVEDNEDIICKITLENWKNKSYFIELNLNNAER